MTFRSLTFRCFLAAIYLVSLACVPVVCGQPQKVQVGYCAQLNEIDAVKAAGFDYVELRTSEIAALSDADYDKLVEKIKQLSLKVPVTYLFIPSNIKVTGPAVDKAQQMNYVRKAFSRVAQLGARIITFGSGNARQVPDGFSKEAAFRQLVEFCRRIAPEAKARNLTITIEPMRRQECNIINTLAEGLELIKAVNHPNIQLMVDFYHLAVEQEDPAIMLLAKKHIRHIHMANPQGRVFPLKWEEYSYVSFFETLGKIGYDKLISIEAKATDFSKEAPQAIAFLRATFAR